MPEQDPAEAELEQEIEEAAELADRASEERAEQRRLHGVAQDAEPDEAAPLEREADAHRRAALDDERRAEELAEEAGDGSGGERR